MDNLSLGIDNWAGTDIEKSIMPDTGEGKKENNDLEKAFNVGSVFNSNDDQFKFSKSGKDIKEKLSKVKADEISEIQACISALKDKQTKIGVVPVGRIDSYDVDKYRHRLKWLPNVYSYEQKYPRKEEESTAYSALSTNNEVSKYVIAEDQRKCANEYNEIAYRTGRLLASMVQLDTLINNLEDKKSYKLSAGQLAMLGF